MGSRRRMRAGRAGLGLYLERGFNESLWLITVAGNEFYDFIYPFGELSAEHHHPGLMLYLGWICTTIWSKSRNLYYKKGSCGTSYIVQSLIFIKIKQNHAAQDAAINISCIQMQVPAQFIRYIRCRRASSWLDLLLSRKCPPTSRILVSAFLRHS
jgi:hypothetical protein